MPKCYVITGPNGLSKTTFAPEFLPSHAGCLNFVNLDLIAAGLSGGTGTLGTPLVGCRYG